MFVMKETCEEIINLLSLPTLPSFSLGDECLCSQQVICSTENDVLQLWIGGIELLKAGLFKSTLSLIFQQRIICHDSNPRQVDRQIVANCNLYTKPLFGNKNQKGSEKNQRDFKSISHELTPAPFSWQVIERIALTFDKMKINFDNCVSMWIASNSA